MKFQIHFHDEVEAESEEQAIDEFLDYLAECVKFGDVTPFEFQEMSCGRRRGGNGG